MGHKLMEALSDQRRRLEDECLVHVEPDAHFLERVITEGLLKRRIAVGIFAVELRIGTA